MLNLTCAMQGVGSHFIYPQTISNLIRMKAALYIIFFVVLCELSEAQTPGGARSILTDKTKYKTETKINNVVIGGSQFSIRVLRDKYDEHLKEFSEEPQTLDEYEFTQSPITIVISKNSDNHPLYIKRFDHEPDDYPYLNYKFYKGENQNLNKQGRLYFRISKGYGGSGSQCATYYIDYLRGQISLSNLFNSSCELFYDVYSQNDKEILLLKGIWGTDESHFGNHRYNITKYTYENGQFNKKEIGQTKYKYSSLDENKTISQILREIKTKETLLLSDIALSDFNIKDYDDGNLSTGTSDINSSSTYKPDDISSLYTKKTEQTEAPSKLNAFAQKTEAEYKEYYRQFNWSASDLVAALDTLIKYTDFKFVKDLKNSDIKSVKATILNLQPDALKQINIDGWYYCSTKHEDLFNLWNLYYKRIDRNGFENYCVIMMFLMKIDGIAHF